MSFKKMTEEEALEMLRAQKGDVDTPGGVLYQLLGDAMPGFKEVMERYAASMLAAGHNVGRVMREVEKNPEDRKAFINQMHTVAQKINAGNTTTSETDEKEKK